MSRGSDTRSRNFPRLLSARPEQRFFGVLLILIAGGMWSQLAQQTDLGEQRVKQNEALVRALTAEQQSAVSNGETPVAPPPSEIVKNPSVVTIKGEKGDPGIPGSDGKNGKDGKDAPTPSPVPGPSGPSGASGASGAPGKDGANGADGAPGAKGDKGDPGPPPSEFNFTVYYPDGTSATYTCLPKSAGSSSLACEPESTPSPTPSESGSAQ